jgi:hypothetical protein
MLICYELVHLNARIASSSSPDVSLDPLQCEMLVKESSIHNAFTVDFIRRQKAKCA